MMSARTTPFSEEEVRSRLDWCLKEWELTRANTPTQIRVKAESIKMVKAGYYIMPNSPRGGWASTETLNRLPVTGMHLATYLRGHNGQHQSFEEVE